MPPAKTRKNPIPEPPPFDPGEGQVALVRAVKAEQARIAASDPDPDMREDAEQRAVLMAQPAIQAVMQERPDGTEPNLEEDVTLDSPVEGQFTDIESDRDIVAIVPSADIPATHHLVVGMGTLAAMSEAEFRAKLAVMKAGQDRIRIIQDQLLTKGEDYGHVPGITKPFLQQPGAEKLANFYGFAVEQIAKREVGRRAMIRVGDTTTEAGDWLSPPLTYHVQSLVHLGDFTGPVVAQGYGEANSWEEKYRYVFAKPLCPQCGHELQRGGKTGKMQGKWFCPGYKGGCWWSVGFDAKNEDGTPVIPAPGKVDNDNPYGLAETLIQMAAKRSLVAAVRRATGTSGLFTQDDDSPSVQQQSDDSGEGAEGTGPVVESASTAGIQVGVGAKTTQSTQVQHDRLKALVKEKGLNGVKIAALLERVFGMEVAPTGAAASAAVKTLDGDQMGKFLEAIETGSVPEATPGEPPQQSDEM